MKNIFFKTEEIKELSTRLKDIGNEIVFTNGVFDIIHRGHVEYLNEAKSLGDVLIVGLNSDKSVKIIKGSTRPINNENDRALVLSNLKAVDYVIIFEEDNPLKVISAILPDILVKGGDWKKDKIIGADVVESNGGKVISLNFVDNYSTTGLIEKMKKN